MSRRHLWIAAGAAAALIAGARASAAQVSQPYGGPFAISGAIGGALPLGDRLENGVYAGGTLRISVASHVALNAEAASSTVTIDRPGFHSDLMPRFVDLDLLFHWRRGPFRPFIAGGVGVYHYTMTVSGDAFADPALRAALLALGLSSASPSGALEIRHDERGANVGGGFDYFLARRAAVTMEVRLHGVPKFVQVAPFDGDFVTTIVGFRQYF